MNSQDHGLQMAHIRIISRDNGVGLTRDMALVADLFRDAGHEVEVVAYGGNRMLDRCMEIGLRLRHAAGRRVDVQIFLERVYSRLLPLAGCNLLIPNPEWFQPGWRQFLPRFDAVLCKTRHGAGIFSALGCEVREIGFTSDDVFDPAVERVREFFHLAGRSSAKGTDAVLDAWALHPEWPLLTVVQNPKTATRRVELPNVSHRLEYIDAAALRRLQNRCLFHLCPSEMEGFGHYLNEALSAGAIVLATDGAPMNELVTPACGVLLAPAACRREGLAERFMVDVAGIEAGVAQALALDDAQIARMRDAARTRYLDGDTRFRNGLVTECLRIAAA